MCEIIDLSQEIFSGMPVFKGLPEASITVHATHEQWAGERDATTNTPSVLKLELSEHTGTHVDALNHMSVNNAGQSIDVMPLSMFYTEAVCLDFSHTGFGELIDDTDIENYCTANDISIKEGDTVLIYTDHYRKAFATENWPNGPGLTGNATRWLGNHKIAAFGVETMSPGVPGISNKLVHQICGEMGFTHYENLVNLNLLVNRGRFRFIALPLKIRGGTGSPVRAVAIFE
ncbi:MAG TPA: cyclase family protein [Flavobacterium sp.]|jgi:kynurenine formamidase